MRVVAYFRRYRNRFRTVAIVALSIAISTALLQTRTMQKLDLSLRDLQVVLFAGEETYDGYLLVDIDEESMTHLQGLLGAWPYSRDVYARVTDYLLEAGAKSITYDILFSEPRQGDAAFAQRLREARNVVLGAAWIEYPLERSAAYLQRLQSLAWRAPQDAPARAWRDMTIPIAALTERPAGAGQVGVFSMRPDLDNISRRFPLLHRLDNADVTLPSLSLASLFAGEAAPTVTYDARRRVLHVGRHSFPIDHDGAVSLRYPRNLRDVPTVPFYQVYGAAKRLPGTQDLQRVIRGKRVFIGTSTAVLGDFNYTPLGQVPGLMMLGVVTHALESGKLQRRAPWYADALLVLIALLVPVLSYRERVQSRPIYNIGVLAAMAGLVFLASSVFYWAGQTTSLLFPILTGLLAGSLFLLMRVFLLYQDKQRLAYEKLAAEEAYRLKSQFISQMTHELRTPLAAIMGFNRLLSEPDVPGKQRNQYVTVVDKNSQHLMQLINNMLDQSKIEAGQMKINRVPTRVRELIDDVVVTLSPLATEKHLVLEAMYHDSLPAVVELDAFRMRQVLLNLVGNAIKFTREGGVTVSVEWSNGVLKIVVRDTGPGMSEETMQRIFIPFKQGSDDMQRRHGGTGLGLSISLNLCELMGGSLRVESKLGSGSAFFATVPAAQAGDSAAPALAVKGGEVTVQRLHGKVVLAEDNNDIRDLVSRLLSKMGLTVLAVANGREAVQAVAAEPPDLVLMDMEMPVLDGVAAVKELRQRGYKRPVLAMTAHPEGPDIERALAEGFDDYLEKPVNRDRLYRTIARLLERDADASARKAQQIA